jgi:hypothetical protein
MSDENKSDNMSVIDAALAKAKERKAAKNGETTAVPVSASETSPNTPKAPKAVASDEEKAAKKAEKDAERAAKKLERDKAREVRKAEKAAEKSNKKAHMSKVDKAAEKLPALDEATLSTFNEITANFSAASVANLAAHLQHFNRVKATERALNQSVKTGDEVTIISGDPRYIGKTGTIVKSQRIRCYVNIPGENNRPVPGIDDLGVYFFTSDVEVAKTVEVEVAATGT